MPATRGIRGTRTTAHPNPWLDAFLAIPRDELMSEEALALAEAAFVAINTTISIGTFVQGQQTSIALPNTTACATIRQITLRALENPSAPQRPNIPPSARGSAGQLLRLGLLETAVPDQLMALLRVAQRQAGVVAAFLSAHKSFIVGTNLAFYNSLVANTSGNPQAIKLATTVKRAVVIQIVTNQKSAYSQRLRSSDLDKILQYAELCIREYPGNTQLEAHFVAEYATLVELVAGGYALYGSCIVHDLAAVGNMLYYYASFIENVASVLIFARDALSTWTDQIMVSNLRISALEAIAFFDSTYTSESMTNDIDSQITTIDECLAELAAAEADVAGINVNYGADSSIDRLTDGINGRVTITGARNIATSAKNLALNKLGILQTFPDPYIALPVALTAINARLAVLGAI